MQQAKVAVGTLSQLAKTSILGRYKISWNNVPTDLLFTLCSTVANKGLLC